MNRLRLLTVAMATMVVGVGCAGTGRTESWREGSAVVVRFSAPTSESAFARSETGSGEAALASDEVGGGYAATRCPGRAPSGECPVHHTVLWGENFSGQEVTHAPVSLVPGSYSFAVFNADDASAFQGWIEVRSGGNNVAEILSEWRDTVREQKQWVGFENRALGNFESYEDEHFEKFVKDLRKIERLERRIDRKFQSESRKWQRDAHRRCAVSADVLMLPGQLDFFRSATGSTFKEAELASVRAGQPMTKVVFVADFRDSKEKLARVNKLWSALKRRRNLLAEEHKRLEHRKRYFVMTDHVLNHEESRFMETEMRLQQVGGLLDRLDQRMNSLRERREAIQFAHALFAPTENFEAFDDEVAELQSELAVLKQEKVRVDVRFDDSPADSCSRVALERNRQRWLAAMANVQRRIDRLTESKAALVSLRDSTNVIFRENSARVLATMVGDDVPAHLADALERESMMTVRLQNADSMFVPPAREGKPARKTLAESVVPEEKGSESSQGANAHPAE